FAEASAGKNALFLELATCVVKSRNGDRLEKLLELVAAQPAGARASAEAIMAGIAEAVAPNGKSKTAPPPRRIRLLREPPALAGLLKNTDKKISGNAEKAQAVMSWPGKPGDTTPPLKPLTAE